MAIRNIVKEGDSILNKVCRPVTNFDDHLATLLDDMRDDASPPMAYLAGPQVGMLRRLFSWCGTPPTPWKRSLRTTSTSSSTSSTRRSSPCLEDEETAYEGCLSFLGHKFSCRDSPLQPSRSGAQDRHGEWFELEAEGLLAPEARESDHLERIPHRVLGHWGAAEEEGERRMRILFMRTPDIARL